MERSSKRCKSCIKAAQDVGGEPLERFLEDLLAQACEIVIDTAETQGVILPDDIYDKLKAKCVEVGIIPDRYPDSRQHKNEIKKK